MSVITAVTSQSLSNMSSPRAAVAWVVGRYVVGWRLPVVGDAVDVERGWLAGGRMAEEVAPAALHVPVVAGRSVGDAIVARADERRIPPHLRHVVPGVVVDLR